MQYFSIWLIFFKLVFCETEQISDQYPESDHLLKTYNPTYSVSNSLCLENIRHWKIAYEQGWRLSGSEQFRLRYHVSGGKNSLDLNTELSVLQIAHYNIFREVYCNCKLSSIFSQSVAVCIKSMFLYLYPTIFSAAVDLGRWNVTAVVWLNMPYSIQNPMIGGMEGCSGFETLGREQPFPLENYKKGLVSVMVSDLLVQYFERDSEELKICFIHF